MIKYILLAMLLSTLSLTTMIFNHVELTPVKGILIAILCGTISFLISLKDE